MSGSLSENNVTSPTRFQKTVHQTGFDEAANLLKAA